MVDGEQALAWRLGRQFLAGARAASVEQVIDRLGAVPAWLGDAEHAVALRMGTETSDAVRTAHADGTLLKVYSFRGSMQYSVPAAASDHLTIRAAGRQWERQSWREFYALEPADWPDLRAAVREALAGGPLTQTELADAVARCRFAHLRAALLHPSHTLLKPLCWQGDLSFAPSRNGEATFQALAGRADWPDPPDLDAAGRRAVLAYLSAYGPATPDRLHYWLGECLSAGRSRITRWVKQLDDRLARVEIDGRAAMIAAEHLDDLETAEPSEVERLLPAYDQWIMGAGTSDELIVPASHRAELSRGAAPVIRGGRVVATWKASAGGPDISRFD